MMSSSLKRIIGALLQSRNRNIADPTYSLPSRQDVVALASRCLALFRDEPVLLRLEGRFNVVGDIHGNVDSLIRIFERLGYPPDSKYLFLGDYVDRGSNSVEVLLLLFALKALYPDKVFLLRGNHECKKLTRSYGFRDECEAKYTRKVYNCFCKCFRYLSIAAILNGAVMCVHGGVSCYLEDATGLTDLEKPIGPITKEEDLVSDLLWSDPRGDIDPYSYSEESDRGCGHFFGMEALDDFLEKFNCNCLIRAHETCHRGIDRPFGNDKCITVFSSADYCSSGNFAGALVVEREVEAEEVFVPLFAEDYEKRRIIMPSWILDDTSSSLLSIEGLLVDAHLDCSLVL